MRKILVINCLIWSLLLVISACGQDVDNAPPLYREELPADTRTLGPRIGEANAEAQISACLPEGHSYRLLYEDMADLEGWWDTTGLLFFRYGVYEDGLLVGWAAAFELQGLTLFSALYADSQSVWHEPEQFDFAKLQPPQSGDGAESVTASATPVETYSRQRAQDKAAAFYPPGVELAPVGRVGIEGKECYLFSVTYEAREVSRVAVTLAGDQVFFQETQELEQRSFSPATDFGLSDDYHYEPPQEEEAYETFLSLTHSAGSDSLYIANLQDLPEFAPANEGGAFWEEERQTLRVILTRAQPAYQGTVTGPQLRMEVDYSSGSANITMLEFRPAPVYSDPRAVLLSGETLLIETPRLLEIADHLRDLIRYDAA